MSHYKNILVFIKKSKLNYLKKNLGSDIKNSSEYAVLNDSMENHYSTSNNFINSLQKLLKTDQKLEIFYDDFEELPNIEDFKNMNNNYDLIFSLGGDGTFFRSLNFNTTANQLNVGVNTDWIRSKGKFCTLNVENYNEKLKNLFENNYSYKNFNKLGVEIKSKKFNFLENNSLEKADNSDDFKIKRFNFINDLYYGEKFTGRISNYNLNLIETRKSYPIKSSGLIVSSYIGYSGWIKNANAISYKKFNNLLKFLKNNSTTNSEIMKLYLQEVYNAEHNDENSIFYFIREPGLKNLQNFPSENDYAEYLNFMEGTVNSLEIQNYCYNGVLILDGTFTIPLQHDDLINITISPNKIKLMI